MRILGVIHRRGRIWGRSVWVVRQRVWDERARCVIWTPGGTYSGMARQAKPESVAAALTQKSAPQSTNTKRSVA